MCLIITGASDKIRATLLNTNGLLSDIYTSNPDGIGIMYATTKGLKVVKTLPKSLADATQFISKLPNDDRQLAIHFRWTTHGDTNMENCHPYAVVPGYVAMMHNGVLHTGNAADTSKSDTWHFIQDFLVSPVTEHPPMIHNNSFLDMLAEFIGDNRFVFMDGDGNISHVNHDQGVEHDGLWFSNTYAWSPSRLIPNYYKSSRFSAKYNKMYTTSWQDDDTYYYNWHTGKSMDDGTPSHTNIKPKWSAHDPRWDEKDFEFPNDDVYEDEPEYAIEDLYRVLSEADAELLSDVLVSAPVTTINNLCNALKPSPTEWTKLEDLSTPEQDVYNALMVGDTESLYDIAEEGMTDRIADVACYYLNWTYRDSRLLLA
jgi:hypothetical protein